jgi:hypothetical protein
MPKTLCNFYIDEPLKRGLKVLKAKTGAPEAELIRRALTEYLGKRGVLPKTTRSRTRA